MDRVSVLSVLSVACILAGVLSVPPVIGIASNGDYAKVALRYNLYSPVEDHFAFAPQRHRFVPEKHWESEMLTSAHLPVLAALALHRLSGQADFDARFLAAVYSSLFLLALAILQPCLAGRSLLLTAAALLTFAIGAFGDCLETTRHLTLFQILLDLLLLALAWQAEKTCARPG
jgi:hypothetical protein